MADLKKLAEELTGLTVLQVNELKTILKDEYGIEPAAAALSRWRKGNCEDCPALLATLDEGTISLERTAGWQPRLPRRTP